MKVVATYSIKGGVGKTTAAVNLANEAARSGVRVLLWDLDAQGAATFLLRLKPLMKGGAQTLTSKKGSLEPHLHGSDVEGLHVVPADFSLRHLDLHLDRSKQPRRRLRTLLEPLADRYDVAILDCPPGINLTSESVFVAADALLVPTIPTTLSKRTLDQLAEFLAERSDPPMVWPFASMVDRRKSLHRAIVDDLIADVPEFLTAGIPSAMVVERMGLERAAVGAYAPRTAAAASFRALWAEIAERLWPD